MLKHLLFFTKILLSGGMIWLVASRLDLSSSLVQIIKIPPGWVAVVISLFYLQLAISAARYRTFLDILDCRASYWRCVDATLVGYFFSQTFISFVGGDAMRTLRMAKSGISVKTSAKAVILDRASGFAGQVTVILLILPFLLPRLPDATTRAWMSGLVLMTLVGTAGIALLARLPDAIGRFRTLKTVSDLSQRIIRRLGTLRGFYAFILLSILISVLNCFIFYAIAIGLSVNVTLLDMVVLLPPVFFLSMLPISISGWGVREGATIVALGLIGVSAADSMSISVCFGLGLIAVSLPGGITWLMAHKKRIPNSVEFSAPSHD